MIRLLGVLIIAIVGFSGIAQSPAFEVNFDNCEARDIVGGFDGDITGSPTCVCGVSGQSLSLNDEDQSIAFPSDIASLFSGDFTISFYAIFNKSSNAIAEDVLSYRTRCDRDSSFSIKYLPLTQEIFVEFSESIARIRVLNAKIDASNCWQYVVVSASDSALRLYINDRLADQTNITSRIPLDPDALLSISDSPCLLQDEGRFTGRIDELKIYDSIIESNIVFGNYLRPDQLITNDTTIFIDSKVQIKASNTCATSISWSPTTGLSDGQILTPLIEPTETTVYKVSMNLGTCTAVDSIRINVVDPTQLTCDQLFLPNAFSPNGDNVNDTYGISNAFIIDELDYFEIFDRWGAKLFSTNDKQMKWDGNITETDNPSNIYLYKIEYTCKGDKYQKNGSFISIR